MEWIKNISYIVVGGVGWAFAYTGCRKEAVYILTILMLIDIVAGVIKVIRLGGKPSSIRLIMGLVSKVLLIMLPMILIITGKGVGIDFSFMASSTLSILILSETYSIIGNIYTIRNGKEIKEYDAISLLLKKIMKTISGNIDKK